MTEKAQQKAQAQQAKQVQQARQTAHQSARPKQTSMYSRQLTLIICLIVFSMTLLGTSFLALSFRYQQNESQKAAERNISYISAYANSAISDGMTLSSQNFRSYLASVAMISDSTILLCQPDGRILYATGTNLSAVLACFNNIGPGLEAVGPTCNFSAYSDFSKLVLILDMLAGRLEIFPILVLFARSTWRHP